MDAEETREIHLILGRQLEIRAQLRAKMSSGGDKADPIEGTRTTAFGAFWPDLEVPLRVEHIPADRLHSICGGEISVYARAARCLAALRINIYPVSSILYSLSCVVFLRPSMFVAPKLRSLHFTSPTPSMSPRGIFNKTHPSLSVCVAPKLRSLHFAHPVYVVSRYFQ